MRKVLHIVTRPNDPLAQTIITRQKQSPEVELEVEDLTGEDVDYKKLLQKIFTADSVEVW